MSRVKARIKRAKTSAPYHVALAATGLARRQNGGFPAVYGQDEGEKAEEEEAIERKKEEVNGLGSR